MPTRLVLTLKNKEIALKQLELRNKTNDLAKQSGYKGLLVTAMRKSVKGNLIVTLPNAAAKGFLSIHLDILRKQILIRELVKDTT